MNAGYMILIIIGTAALAAFLVFVSTALALKQILKPRKRQPDELIAHEKDVKIFSDEWLQVPCETWERVSRYGYDVTGYYYDFGFDRIMVCLHGHNSSHISQLKYMDMFRSLVKKYGVVPKSAMPETYQSNNTGQMSMILSLKLREFGLELRGLKPSQAAERKVEMLTEIYRILVECLGVPPEEFEWTRCDKDGNPVETRRYTPKGFYDEYIGEDLEKNYVMVMNDPSREYGKVYEIEYDRHVYDGENWLYVNLPIERVKEMAIASIKDNTAMYFSCDVGKFLDRTKGTLDVANMDYASLFGTTFGMDKRERIQTYASGSSHAMTLIAVDLDDDGKPRKWMVENSWGASSGYQGCLIMTDEWFDEYMFRVVVERKYVPQDVLDMLDQEPVMLPAWDPMFAPEE